MPIGPQLPDSGGLPPAEWAEETLRRIENDGLLSRPRVRRGGSGTVGLIDGREVTVFSSNDYLGLACHPAVTAAAASASMRDGVGATGSRTLSGCHATIEALEAELAAFAGAEAATLAPSGYAANLAVLQTLGGPDAVVLSDERNHASIVDGARLARGHVGVYAHGDLAALEGLLRERRGRAIIVSDTVFSMDGTVADVAGLHRLAREHSAWLVLDEAHAAGVLGPGGRGAAAAELDTGDPQLVRVVTLGNALGASGGAVLGSAAVRTLLLNRGRALIHSAALPHPVVAAARAALATLRDMPELVARLHTNAALFRTAVSPLGVPGGPDMPIVLVLCGEPHRAVALERALLRRGHLVQAVRPPAVPAGASRVRIAVSAAHTGEQLRGLAADLVDLHGWMPAAEVSGKPVERALRAKDAARSSG